MGNADRSIPSLDELTAAIDLLDPIDQARLVERFAIQLQDKLPARHRLERDRLIRAYARRYGPRNSVRSAERWLTREYRTFQASAAWKAARHQITSPFADERRRLMWRIGTFGALPGQSTLRQILTQSQ